MTGKLKRTFSEDHIYRDLTIALMLVLCLSPVLIWLTGTTKFNGYLSAAFLLFALYEITRRTSDVIGLVLGLPAVAGGIINAETPDTPLINLGPTVFGGIFIGFLIWRILKDVLTGSRVTQERIFGSVCTYLLIGFLFAEIYGFILIADNQAFAVSDGIRGRWAQGDTSGLGEMLTYFSFVTMTTLGFGDISPVSPAARTVVWTQALIGQLYLAIMIAGLVGIHISKSRD